MRANSFFSREAGTSTLAWRAINALRTRVSMSAMGSNVISPASLPARLRHTRDLAGEREFPETNPAERKLAQKSARTPAIFAAIAQPGGKLHRRLRCPRLRDLGQLLHFFSDLRGSCHEF